MTRIVYGFSNRNQKSLPKAKPPLIPAHLKGVQARRNKRVKIKLAKVSDEKA